MARRQPKSVAWAPERGLPVFRLPNGVTWLHVGAFALAIGAGFYVDREVTERRRLLASLVAYAKSHPQDADMASMLASCHRRIIVDVAGCSKQLVSVYGPSTLERLGRMQADGAFGVVSQ